mgnify:CR=1 FL=1
MTVEEMADIHARAMVHSRVWGVPTLQGFLSAPGAVFVFEQHSFALGRVVADEAELLTIAVAPEVQRHGLGRKCLAAFEGTAASDGAKRVFLEVSAENSSAIKLYTSEGYVEDGRRRGYYTANDGRKSDALLMSKTLTVA